MKKIFEVVVAALVFAASTVSALEVQQPPVYLEGDTWKHKRTERNGDETIITNRIEKVSGSMLTISWETSKGGSGTYYRDTSFNPRVPGTSGSTARYAQVYNFPLQVGKSWPASYERPAGKDGKSYSYDIKMSVVGIETVKVPAGTFDAFKMVLSGRYIGKGPNGTWKGILERTIWYSPQVKREVRQEYRDTTEFSGFGIVVWTQDRFELIEYAPSKLEEEKR